VVKRFAAVIAILVLCPNVHAAIFDLTTAESTEIINGAIFHQYTAGPAGSGNIDAFVRIQAVGIQEGYNTSGRPVEFDENTSPTFTHSILLSSIPIVSDNGTDYRQFMLDINQNGQDILSVDELRIAMHSTGDLNTYSTIFSSPIYDLDAGGDNWILLDSTLSSGSGAGDMLVYFENSLFDGPDQYIYLYSKFGVNSMADDGFEEWSYGMDGPIPEPATIVLFGLGGLALIRKRRA
jgi:hypothetical protein